MLKLGEQKDMGNGIKMNYREKHIYSLFYNSHIYDIDIYIYIIQIVYIYMCVDIKYLFEYVSKVSVVGKTYIYIYHIIRNKETLTKNINLSMYFSGSMPRISVDTPIHNRHL